MGLFSRNNARTTVTNKSPGASSVASGPIEPDPKWAKHVGPHPTFAGITSIAVAAAGVSPEDVDLTKLYNGIVSVFSAQAEAYFNRLSRPDGVSGLRTILARDDYNDDMPWDFLTTLGASGVAVYDNLSDMLSSTDFVDMLATQIREGAFAHGE
jgi:hypothetical protein